MLNHLINNVLFSILPQRNCYKILKLIGKKNYEYLYESRINFYYSFFIRLITIFYKEFLLLDKAINNQALNIKVG